MTFDSKYYFRSNSLPKPNQTEMLFKTDNHRTSPDIIRFKKKGSSMVSSKRKDSSLQLYHARTENFKKSGYLTKKWLFHEKVYVYSKSEYCMKKWFLKEVAICILEHTNLMIIGPFHNNYEIYFSSIGVTPWFRVYIPWTKCSCNSLQSEWTVVWSKSWVRFVVGSSDWTIVNS